MVFILGVVWAIVMHAYSAVFDIEFDRMAKINTIATFLGHIKIIIFYSIIYTLSFFIIISNMLLHKVKIFNLFQNFIVINYRRIIISKSIF